MATCALAPGCQTAGSPSGPPPVAALSLGGTTWRVDQIGDQPVQGPEAPTITFEGAERVSGSTGCNRYTASLTVAGSSLRVGDAAMTRRACPPAVMEQEGRFVAALAAVRGYRLDGATVQLHDESGQTLLRLIGT